MHLVDEDKYKAVCFLDDLPNPGKQCCDQLAALREPFAEEAVRVHLNQLALCKSASEQRFSMYLQIDSPCSGPVRLLARPCMIA